MALVYINTLEKHFTYDIIQSSWKYMVNLMANTGMMLGIDDNNNSHTQWWEAN